MSNTLEKPERIPYWESHIRPMFRPIDQDNMANRIRATRRFDLWNYEQVTARTAKIIDWITGEPSHCMPPTYAGGPWPEEWIALFIRWVEKGCPRLGLGDAFGWAATFKENRTIVRLDYSVRKARSSDKVWLERETESDSPREYVLYLEPGTTGEAVTVPGALEFPATPGVTTVSIRDLSGTNTHTITG